MDVEDMDIDVASAVDSDYEEEEYLLYLEVDPSSMAETQIREESANLKLFGLDTKQPLLQIKNQFFKGEFDLSMGTHVFFEKDEERPVDELYCKCETYHKYAAKTNKVLKVSRVLLKDKVPESSLLPEKDIKEIRNQLKVTKTYEDVLNLVLAPGRRQPRSIAKDFNGENLIRNTAKERDSGKQITEDKQE